MQISKENYAELTSRIVKANSESDYELECVVTPTNGISNDQFRRVHAYMNQLPKFERVSEEDSATSLDISLIGTNYRVTLNGMGNISNYCNTGNMPGDITVIEKSRIEGESNVRLTGDNDVYFKSKRERDVKQSEIPDFFQIFNASQKHFRVKKRCSFVHGDGFLRIDLTVVRMSERPSMTMVPSGVVKASERFEIEVEYLNEKNTDPDTAVHTFSDVVQEILLVLGDTDTLMSSAQKETVLCSYLSMVNRAVLDECDKDITRLMRSKVMVRPKQYFLSYQPVTLEQQNVLEPELGRLSILDDYTVTEKADGERMLLYVDGDNNMYTINSALEVRNVGMKHKYRNCLVDGEFVKQSKFKTKLNWFMAFDVYFLNGRDTRNAPLIPTRFDQIKDFVSGVPKKGAFVVKTKQYLHGEDIFKLSKAIYDGRSKFSYHIDGLIYTPAKLSVGAYYKGEASETNTFGGTWASVFKWKPPEENSIDMLVVYGGEKFVPDLGRCVFAELQVAHNAGAHTRVDPLTVLSGATIVNSSTIIPKTFKSVYFTLRDGDTKPRTVLNEVIHNHEIVEFTYDPLKSELQSWVPYRLRKDKTVLYARNKSVANAANSYNTAMNVWRSIQNPVSTTVITGEDVLTPGDVVREDVYYARNVSRQKILSKPMLKFHNQAVKQQLFNLFKNQSMSLLEVASGKAGDLNKWAQARFTRVVGIDNNLDNLLNTRDGAYKRLYQFNKRTASNMNALFVQKDISESWSETNSIQDEGMRKLYNLLLTKSNKKHGGFPPGALKFSNALNDGFNVISCQFAIHYMFQSDKSLDTFCENVDKVLKTNGYFIGTCLNGRYVNAMLGSRVERSGTVDDNVLWMIRKKYDTYAEKTTGQTVGVFVESINSITDEYLVDFELLKEKLAPYNIRELSKEDLAKMKLAMSIGDFRDWYDASKYPMDDTLKEFSFLNSCTMSENSEDVPLNDALEKRNKELFEQLQCNKNKIDNQRKWDIAKKCANEYEFIFSFNNEGVADYVPISRSYFKLIEMIYDNNLLAVGSGNKGVRCACLCEGPGGFVQALNDTAKKKQIHLDPVYCITLISNNKKVPNWKLSSLFNYIISTGQDGTGNIYLLENIDCFAKQVGVNSCDIVTADGGFDFSSNFNTQEIDFMLLLMCEVYTCMNVQRKGGTFVLKMFDLFHPNTIRIVTLLRMMYDTVSIQKPKTSRPANSEKYLICRGFRTANHRVMQYVRNQIDRCSCDISNTIDDALYTNTLMQVSDFNAMFVKTQIDYINKTLDVIKNNVFNKKQYIATCKGWCEKYDIPLKKNV